MDLVGYDPRTVCFNELGNGEEFVARKYATKRIVGIAQNERFCPSCQRSVEAIQVKHVPASLIEHRHLDDGTLAEVSDGKKGGVGGREHDHGAARRRKDVDAQL